MPAPETARLTPSTGAGRERPLVSMEGWARFEERARQRRMARRLDAARNAIRAGQFEDARAALQELQELDASHPEVRALAGQLAGTAKPPSRRGARAAAAAVFATVVLASSWIGTTGLLQSYPIVETAALAPVPEALLASTDLAFDPSAATSGDADAVLPDAIAVDTGDSEPLPTPPIQPYVDLPAPVATEVAFAPPSTAPTQPPLSPPPLAAIATPAAATVVDVDPVVDEAARVRAVLQRYQAAYGRLDATQVHAIWPGVDRAALARAFEGLESQALTFKACDVRLSGATANAVCTGSTRYVPRIGSHEPRVEQLAWNFTLRKRADDWEIETARAER